MEMLVDNGFITKAEAIEIARSRNNFIHQCKTCNNAQGSKLMGNHPGHRMPPNPTTPLINYLRSIGALVTSCLIAEHCWDRVRWALEEHAWRFERVGVPGTTRRR
jgi:hypothetical protein